MVMRNSDDPSNVAIVGLGPGGLAAALKAARNGLSVVAFTNRLGLEGYTRTQRIALTTETEEFLDSLRAKAGEKDQKLDDLFWKKI